MGRPVADRLLRLVARRAAGLTRPPCLAVLLIGRDPASELYVRLKRQAAKQLGFDFRFKHYFKPPRLTDLLKLVARWNTDPKIDGILVQLPLPRSLLRHTGAILDAVAPEKDVDGFHPHNQFIEPVLPQAIMRLLRQARPRSGSRSVVLARSKIFGEMMTQRLRRAGYQSQMIICPSRRLPPELLAAIKRAQVIVTALGVPGILRAEFIQLGAVVIDAGIARVRGKVRGDAAPAVAARAGWLTPVPGGVGPVTVACLFYNLVCLARRNAGGGS